MYILQHFTAELCNFTKHRMLFQAVVIFLPILNFFKFHVKGERSIATDNHLFVSRQTGPNTLNCFKETKTSIAIEIPFRFKLGFKFIEK